MAHVHHDYLRGNVGVPLWIPAPEESNATGLVIGDLLDLRVAVDGVLIATPITTLDMAWVEVDDISAPGLYYLRFTPDREGQWYLEFGHTSHTFEYSIEVGRTHADGGAGGDPSLEGEYTVTVEAPSGGVVQGAVVRVFDAAGTLFITRGTTDANGEVVFTLPIGNYQVRAFKDGIDFSAVNPTTITVTPTAEAAPIVDEALPIEGSIGDTIAVIGRLFDQTSQVLFGAEATVAADYVNPEGTVLLVTVPALTGTIFALRVDKPDPANLPTGKLLSNSVTWVRV
jgi:hypothetical protein